MFMVLPAAVLFATVFSIGSFTRHAETTAAKASGISFYRLILPILLGAVLACGLDLALGEEEPAAVRLVADMRERHVAGPQVEVRRLRADAAQRRTGASEVAAAVDRGGL